MVGVNETFREGQCPFISFIFLKVYLQIESLTFHSYPIFSPLKIAFKIRRIEGHISLHFICFAPFLTSLKNFSTFQILKQKIFIQVIFSMLYYLSIAGYADSLSSKQFNPQCKNATLHKIYV